jgi:hypothetical protein
MYDLSLVANAIEDRFPAVWRNYDLVLLTSKPENPDRLPYIQVLQGIHIPFRRFFPQNHSFLEEVIQHLDCLLRLHTAHLLHRVKKKLKF